MFSNLNTVYIKALITASVHFFIFLVTACTLDIEMIFCVNCSFAALVPQHAPYLLAYRQCYTVGNIIKPCNSQGINF